MMAVKVGGCAGSPVVMPAALVKGPGTDMGTVYGFVGPWAGGTCVPIAAVGQCTLPTVSPDAC